MKRFLRRRAARALVCAVVFLVAGGVPPAGGDSNATPSADSEAAAAGDAQAGFSVEAVAGNLEVPRSTVFAPGDDRIMRLAPTR